MAHPNMTTTMTTSMMTSMAIDQASRVARRNASCARKGVFCRRMIPRRWHPQSRPSLGKYTHRFASVLSRRHNALLSPHCHLLHRRLFNFALILPIAFVLIHFFLYCTSIVVIEFFSDITEWLAVNSGRFAHKLEDLSQ